jgi:L-amino acid N-acyltransferase YncA
LNIISCDAQRHSAAILDIFNEAIANSTALYDYRPRPAESMVGWFEAKARGRYPVVGVENDQGELMGFASYGPFRAWPAYKYTIEHSVYVDHRFRGQGVGRALLGAVILAAEKQDYHVMVGGIDAANATSIKLHESLGFKACGIVRHAGFKFGRWLDLAFYQLILRTPAAPVDG